MTDFTPTRLLVVIATCIAISASAQTPATSIKSIGLDPFPVVGTRLPTEESAYSPAVVLVDREFIDRSGATDLTALLLFRPQTYGTSRALFNLFTGALVPLRQTRGASVGLRGLGAAGTLILLDGRRLPLTTQQDRPSDTGPRFYDLSTIALGLVERVEVLSSGASAIHGSDGVSGVVNIVIRQNYTGSERSAGIRSTADGGAFERHATFSTGFTRDKLNLMFSATARLRNALKVSQRTYSSSQNLTALGGRDHRLSVGSPAVLTAVSGAFNGLTDA
jgi:iron complex outermembrane receptor protein